MLYNESMHQTIGIVLQTIPFQDHHRIVSLYSPDWGVIPLMVKFAKSKKQASPFEPLNLLEVIFKQGRGNLLQSVAATLLDSQLKLRSSFGVLNAALDMLAALKNSQMDHKPSPILFSLLLHYLNFLPRSLNPNAFSASFKLKILRHDGLMAIQEVCSLCNKPLNDGGIVQGEFFCMEHLSSREFIFSGEERILLSNLTLNRSLIALNELSLSPEFAEKIRILFETLARG